MTSRASAASSGSAYDGSTLRLRSVADIVAIIPYLVGFQPVHSLVVACLGGERGRVGLTLRADLPDPEWAEECARWLVDKLQRNSAERVVVAFYPRDGGIAAPEIRPLHDALTERLDHAGIGVKEAVVVADGRWWSLTCSSPRCCPPEGTPLAGSAEPSLVDVAMAVEGRRVLPSRAALEATVAPVTGLRAEAMRYALDDAEPRFLDRVCAGRREEVARETLEVLGGLVDGRAERADAIGVDTAARILVGLEDVEVRDQVLCWYGGSRRDGTYAVLRDLAPLALEPFHTVVLTLLGWFAYLHGDGALASMAVERVLAGDPDYSLARILDDALLAGIPPEQFRPAYSEPLPPPPSRGRKRRATNL